MGASQGGCSGCFAFTSRGRKRILVTGASGLLGRQVMRELKKHDFEIRGLYSRRELDGLYQADLTNEGEVEKQFADFHPDAVIHCAAERRPDVVLARPDESKFLNEDVTRKIAEACAHNKAWLINISTDYVFDGKGVEGKCPPFTTEQEPKPLNEYGHQKLRGEVACKEACPTSATVRVPLLFGPMEYVKESAVTTLYLDLRQTEKPKTPDDLQKRYPTYTKDVARILVRMLEVYFSGKKLAGIYQWQAKDMYTKYTMMLEIAKLFQLSETDIQPGRKLTSKGKAERPENSQMDCSKLEIALAINGDDYRTPFKQALTETFETFPVKSVVEDIVAKVDSNVGVEKDKLEKILQNMNMPICNKEVQKLMNRNDKDKLNQAQYNDFIAAVSA
jgi:S-adenosylmethionine synthetase